MQRKRKKLQTKTEDSQAEIYYDGIYTFGMDTYVTLKVTARMMYAIAIMIMLFCLVGGFIIFAIGLIFAGFTRLMVKSAEKKFGFILYTNEYITAYLKGGKDVVTMPIAGMKSMEYKYPKYTFTDGNQTVQIISGGGKGLAGFIEHMNERRPDLVDAFYQNKNVVNAYNFDRNGGFKY